LGLTEKFKTKVYFLHANNKMDIFGDTLMAKSQTFLNSITTTSSTTCYKTIPIRIPNGYLDIFFWSSNIAMPD